MMEVLASTIYCIWHYHTYISSCIVIVICCFYVEAIDKSDEVLELHIFRNQV